MARVLPSMVVAQIGRTFPGIGSGAEPPVLRAERGPKVAPILRLFDLMPQEHLADLPTDDQILLLCAVAEIRECVVQWRFIDVGSRRGGGVAALLRIGR